MTFGDLVERAKNIARTCSQPSVLIDALRAHDIYFGSVELVGDHNRYNYPERVKFTLQDGSEVWIKTAKQWITHNHCVSPISL